MPDAKRTAYFVSDRTGITAEMLFHTADPFDGVRFTRSPAVRGFR